MRCGPRSVCRTRTARAGLLGCACVLGTAGPRLPATSVGLLQACLTTWTGFLLDGACARGLGGKSWAARPAHRAGTETVAAPGSRAPTCGLGRRSSSQRARPTGHTFAGNSDELPAPSPPGTPGTSATHHGCHCRSPFSGHCTGVSMSTHRAIRGPCTDRRWQLRPRPASRAPSYLRLGPKLQLTACPADGALPTLAIPPNCLLSPRPAHRAPWLSVRHLHGTRPAYKPAVPARAAARSQPAFPSPFTAVLPRIVLRLPSQAAPVIQSTPRRR